jgi:flagellar basal-body rod modification protein FlgD
MTTTGVGQTPQSSTNSTTKNNPYDLKPADFINMMVTQLQNQDPTQPVKNEELLAQMSQISQLQSSTTLTSTLQGLTLQNSIGSASSLIGKNVSGLDANNDPISGLVTSIKVSGSDVNLQLDNGNQLALGSVTDISPGPTGTTAAVN